MLSGREKKRRALVLGLDGVPKGLIERLSADGTMPFLGELFRRGALHRMRVCLPEISSVNWSSFMTGANPGKHGIFGFTDLKPGSYEMTFPSFPQLKTDTLWDELGAHGKRCLVINQPGCYPAREIPGVMVSGFVAVDLKRAVSPRAHAAALQDLGYQIDVDTRGCREDSDKLFRELDACLVSREKALRYFLGQEDWDFVELVITGTDRLQHFVWTSCDGDGPERDRALEYYHKCDTLCRTAVEVVLGETQPEAIYLMSDHGFCALEREFNLNVWLRQEGFLRFEKELPETYADISADSLAFALDPGRIYLHTRGRYPKGTAVDESVEHEIAAKLADVEFEGRRVFERISRGNEIYHGAETPNGPDLVCTGNRGFDIKGAIRKTELVSNSAFTGMHTWDDAFFWANRDCGEDLVISDLRRIIAGGLLDS